MPYDVVTQENLFSYMIIIIKFLTSCELRSCL